LEQSKIIKLAGKLAGKAAILLLLQSKCTKEFGSVGIDVRLLFLQINVTKVFGNSGKLLKLLLVHHQQ
jgi:hypothetical protein